MVSDSLQRHWCPGQILMSKLGNKSIKGESEIKVQKYPKSEVIKVA